MSDQSSNQEFFKSNVIGHPAGLFVAQEHVAWSTFSHAPVCLPGLCSRCGDGCARKKNFMEGQDVNNSLTMHSEQFMLTLPYD